MGFTVTLGFWMMTSGGSVNLIASGQSDPNFGSYQGEAKHSRNIFLD